jgi:hypothetical protein
MCSRRLLSVPAELGADAAVAGGGVVSASEHAQAAAESIRALNHVSFPRSDVGYEWPSDVDSVVIALRSLAARLPQALEQAGRWLATAHAAGRVGHDRMPAPSQAGAQDAVSVDAAVAEVVTALEDAARFAELLERALGRAQRVTSHLTGVFPSDGRTDDDDAGDADGGELR